MAKYNDDAGDWEPIEKENADQADYDQLLKDKAARELDSIFAQARTLHLKKRQDYAHSGGDVGDDLGAAGQYAEIHRKAKKLKAALWEGKLLQYEQPEEILMDLMGHCAKTIQYLRNGNTR